MTLRRFALLAAVPFALSASFAQEKPKQEPKKKLERIAIADPKELKDNADFAVQGEYVSDPKAKYKFAYQVVARGDGKFDMALYEGGLPGEEGVKFVSLKDHTAERKGGAVEVSYPVFGKVTKMGEIKDGKLTLENQPGVVYTKVERKSPTLGAEPPKGAVVLFGKEGDEKNWGGGKLVELSDGKFLNNGIKSKQAFGAFSAHVEFRLPWMPNSTGQQRGNSGVYLQDRYECQVLDSFGLKGENNECGGFYTLHKPKVNMCLPPMVWQTYDIEFTPAVFADGKKTKNARATVKHNGVTIHDDVELTKATGGGQEEKDTPGMIQFQNHGDPVVFRNVWVVEKK
jgi:hypothetical protein